MALINVFMIRYRCYRTNEWVWWPDSLDEKSASKKCKELAFDCRTPVLYYAKLDPISLTGERRGRIRYRRRTRAQTTIYAKTKVYSRTPSRRDSRSQ